MIQCNTVKLKIMSRKSLWVFSQTELLTKRGASQVHSTKSNQMNAPIKPFIMSKEKGIGREI